MSHGQLLLACGQLQSGLMNYEATSAWLDALRLTTTIFATIYVVHTHQIRTYVCTYTPAH